MSARKNQTGVGFFGFVIWLVMLSFIGVVGMKAGPTVLEFTAIKRAVKRISSTHPNSVAEVQSAFNRQREVDSISSISGADLEVSGSGDLMVISFAYDKEIQIAGPVYLLLKYRGTSR